MSKWFCCARHERGLKHLCVGPEARNWAFATDSWWDLSWADSAANANTLILPAELKTAKHGCDHISPLGCGTWKPSPAVQLSGPRMFQTAFDTFFSHNLLQVQCHQGIRKIFCALFSRSSWLHPEATELCWTCFSARARLLTWIHEVLWDRDYQPVPKPQSEQAFCPHLIRVNPHRLSWRLTKFFVIFSLPRLTGPFQTYLKARFPAWIGLKSSVKEGSYFKGQIKWDILK